MKRLEPKAWIVISVFFIFLFFMFSNRSYFNEKVESVLPLTSKLIHQPLQRQKTQCDAIKTFKKSSTKKISKENIDRLFFQSNDV